MKKNPSSSAETKAAHPDDTAADMWAEVFALRAGAEELFKKALRAHKDLCDVAEDEIPRKEKQQKLDGILWEATALLNIASDMVAEHYSKENEPTRKAARS